MIRDSFLGNKSQKEVIAVMIMTNLYHAQFDALTQCTEAVDEVGVNKMARYIRWQTALKRLYWLGDSRDSQEREQSGWQ